MTSYALYIVAYHETIRYQQREQKDTKILP